MARPRQRVTVACTTRETPFEPTTQQLPYWRKTGRAFCSRECGRAAWREAARLRGPSEANRAALSRAMRANNPMRNPVSRAKMSATLRRIGHQPKVRGGNGRGPTEPQRLLAEALGWPIELVVPTGAKGRNGPPSHYKLDIAHPTMKIAVEIDGGSHCSLVRREQDQRKETWLRGEGWTVLRFSNREVMGDTAACARTVTSTTWRLAIPTPTESPEA